MSKLPKGFSLQITGGRWGGIYVCRNRTSWRLALGWLAITLFFYDFEIVFHDLVNKLDKAQGPHRKDG